MVKPGHHLVGLHICCIELPLRRSQKTILVGGGIWWVMAAGCPYATLRVGIAKVPNSKNAFIDSACPLIYLSLV
jgi:hypothetical protein